MKFWKNSQEYFRTGRCEDVLQDESEVCITDAQSLDRLSLHSQEELEEVNIERYLQVLPVIIIVNITIIVNIISSRCSQSECWASGKLVKGL